MLRRLRWRARYSAKFRLRGHLPVTIPGVDLKAGFGIELPANPMKLQPMDVRVEAQLQPAFTVIENAIADKAFPGATVAIGYRGQVSYHAFGKLSYDKNSPAVKLDTMYDLASLTKVVVTTTLVEKLVEGDFASSARPECASRTLSAGVGQRSATGMAAQESQCGSDDAHFGPAPVQGILAHVNGQARYSEHDFCRAVGV